MLQLNNVNNKYSTEEFNLGGTFIAIGILILVVRQIRILYDDIKYKKEYKKQEELQKYFDVLMKYYPQICNYIKTELNNDSFFFTDKRDLYKISSLIEILKERLEKLKILEQIPIPTENDDEDSYNKKLSKHFHGKRLDMSDKWYNTEEISATYSSCEWLMPDKISQMLKLQNQVGLLDHKCYNILGLKIGGKQLLGGCMAESVLHRWVSGAFHRYTEVADGDDKYSDGIGDAEEHWYYQKFGASVMLKFVDITKHLMSYLKSKYGSSTVENSIKNNSLVKSLKISR